MKRRLSIATIFLILAAGLMTYFYPDLSDIWRRIRTTAEIAEYKKIVDSEDEARMDAMIKDAEEYNRALSGELSMDPFGTERQEPFREDEQYNSLLEVNGMMGYIDIPKIDVFLPVYHGTGSEQLLKGAGHLYGSSLPVGGAGTHSVISAHRGLPSAKYFTDLDQLEEGDVFYYHILNRILAYQVDQIKVVEPTELEALDRTGRKDYMTLFTCTPYGINSHRLLIRGSRIPYEAGGNSAELAQKEPPKLDTSLPAWITAWIVGIVGVVALGVFFIFYRWRKDKKTKRSREDG